MAPMLRHRVVFACVLTVIVRYSSAGPLLRLKRQVPVADENPMPLESLCIVGEMKYALGAAVPGDSCDQCVCGSNSSVECTRVACDPAPGCKALHRPDHCCPLYQCECEVDGRTFANGEKRIDPADPCSVCYCQGGDFACSRLACFRRDDCEARFHPGRCCPEYDHCPIRGASTEPNQHGNTSFGDQKELEVEVPEIIDQKKEITIKEITPVSEIPSVSGIRIKEILKPSNLEVSEYNYDGTKSPLIPREALYNQTTAEPAITTEGLKTSGGQSEQTSTNPSSTVESETTDKVLYIKLGNLGYENKGASTPATVIKVIGAEGLQRGEEDENIENNLEFAHSIEPKVNYEQLESKTNNTTNVENVTLILTEVVNELYRTTTTEPSDSSTTSTSNPNSIQSTDKSSIAQQYNEEDLPLVEHNPEFPPIPDDIMVLNVPDDNTDLSPETIHLEVDHGSHSNAENIVLVKRPVFSLPSYQDKTETNRVNNENDKSKILQEVLPLVKINGSNTSDVTTIIPEDWLKSTASDLKTSPLLNLETAIPQDILNLPAEIINDDEIKISNISYAIEFDKDTTTTEEPVTTSTVTNELDAGASEKNESEKNAIPRKIDVLPVHTTDITTSPDPSTQMTNSYSTDSTSTTLNLLSTSINEVTEKTDTNFSHDNAGTTLKGSTEPLDSTVGIAETKYGTATNGPNPSLSRLVIKEVLPSSTHDPSYTINDFSTTPPNLTLTTQGYSTALPNADETAQSLPSGSTENPLKVYEITEKISADQISTSGMASQADSLSTLGFSIKEVGTKAHSTVADINAPSMEIATTMIPSENITEIKSTGPPHNNSVSSELAGKSSTVGNGKSNNILADLISLVEDVATIGSRKSAKNSQDSLKSEELMLTSLNGTAKEIDSGFTLDPITDIDNDNEDESTSTTDRREQTTKKPIIDDVSDVNLQLSTTEGLKDVEFVPKVNVPTLETMPKKLVTEETFVAERSTSTHLQETSPTISLINHSSEAKHLSTESTAPIEMSTTEKAETTKSENISTTASI